MRRVICAMCLVLLMVTGAVAAVLLGIYAHEVIKVLFG